MNSNGPVNPAIELIGVSKRFKDVTAVDNISLTIHRGEYLALLGPNGAGKTTLVEMVEGLQQPTQGSIRVLGHGWHNHQGMLHREIGISLQETRFIEKLTARETLALFASFYGLGKKRLLEILETVGLTDKAKSYVVNLSGGQRQRLALGVALLNSPKLLLLDEPTTGLDPASRREIWDILINLRRMEGTTLILTTHYMEEASFLCERILIMDHGKILTQGTLNELLIKQDKGEIIEFITSSQVDPGDFQKIPAVRTAREERQGKIHLVVDNNVQALPAVLKYLDTKEIGISSLECRKYTLEDLFIDLTGRKFDDEA
ncbi:MAG: ABC transporter ATP-binding protein [Bacteroidales bacterium]